MQATTTTAEKKVEVGIFLDVESAARAVGQLLDAKFTKDHITVVCSDANKEKYFREYEHQEPAGTFAPSAAAAGGTLGALLGALPVLSIAAVTGGSVLILVVGAAAAGALGITGGLVGAMMTRGVEKELANYYQQAVIDGKLLVAAECEGANCAHQLNEAAQIFAAAGAKPLKLPEG